MITGDGKQLVRVDLLNKTFGVGILDEIIPSRNPKARFSKFWFFDNNSTVEEYPETLENIELSYSEERFEEVDILELLIRYHIVIPFNLLFNAGDCVYTGEGGGRGVGRFPRYRYISRIVSINDRYNRVCRTSMFVGNHAYVRQRFDLANVRFDPYYFFDYDAITDTLSKINDVSRESLSPRVNFGISKVVDPTILGRLDNFTSYSEYTVKGYLL